MELKRIIYRGHLLPPFIIPFTSPRSYLMKINPQHYQQIKNMRVKFSEEKMNEINMEFIELNQTIYYQMSIFKQNYIKPLENCPTFYERYHQTIFQQIFSSSQQMDYFEVSTKINKKTIFTQFQKDYLQFKANLPSSFFNQVKFIPNCIYFSPKQMVRERVWQSLSQQEQTICQIEFRNYLSDYRESLKNIAISENIRLQQLIQLMKDQYQNKDERMNTLFQ